LKQVLLIGTARNINIENNLKFLKKRFEVDVLVNKDFESLNANKVINNKDLKYNPFLQFKAENSYEFVFISQNCDDITKYLNVYSYARNLKRKTFILLPDNKFKFINITRFNLIIYYYWLFMEFIIRKIYELSEKIS